MNNAWNGELFFNCVTECMQVIGIGDKKSSDETNRRKWLFIIRQQINFKKVFVISEYYRKSCCILSLYTNKSFYKRSASVDT